MVGERKRMKNLSAYLAVILSVGILLSAYAPKVYAFGWRDDFNYEDYVFHHNDTDYNLTGTGELAKAGWTLMSSYLPVTPFYISVDEGVLTFQNYSAINYTSFPAQIYNFSFETGCRGKVNFAVLTERHEYRVENPSEGEYLFLVDGHEELSSSYVNYTEWSIIALKKSGNIFSLYVDGTLKGNYIQADNALDGLSAVVLSDGRLGASHYDYVSVSDAPQPPPVEPYILIFLTLLIILGLVVFLFLLAFSSRKRR